MYTSVINMHQNYFRKTFLTYLGASLFCAVFGAVYEIFSHGVISVFMIGAFVFPLFGGALPFLLFWLSSRRERKAGASDSAQLLKAAQGDLNFSWQDKQRKHVYPGILSSCLYHCGIIALTVGSLMTGVLEIYGTTNRLLSLYWLSGALLMLAGIVIYIITALLPRQQKTVR